MSDDTADAMANLRESCAIAAGKAPMPTMTDMFTGEARQVTCYQTGEWAECVGCGWDVIVVTDGRKEWATCPECGDVTTFP